MPNGASTDDHLKVIKLVGGAILCTGIGAACIATYWFLQRMLILSDGIALWALFAACLCVVAAAVLAFWMAAARAVAMCLWSLGAEVPAVVQHITSKAVKAAIDREGVIKPGTHLTLLGSAVYVQTFTQSVLGQRIQQFAQTVALNEKPPFLHRVRMSELEVITIRVTNANRLIPYTFRGSAWAVRGPIYRNATGDFEV